jgi:Ca2+-binding EF-hand superfamily protein
MLSPDTKNKLKDFLMAIANGELAVEKRRQSLAMLGDFEPYSAFIRIDRNGDNIIDAGDVAQFLAENQRMQFTPRDCLLVVKYFDIDQDGGLNYTEFLQMVLPCDDLVLRAEASQRQAGAHVNRYAEGERVYTSYSVERALSDFLEQEIHLHLQLESLKCQLHSKFDWNMHNAFACVDVTREGFLNYRNIQEFLRMSGQFASDEQVIAMVRRLDADADQMVQFPEFCEILTPGGAVATAREGNPYSIKSVVRRNKHKKNLSESTGRRSSKSPYRSASVRKSQRTKSTKQRYPQGDSPLRAKSTSNRMSMPRRDMSSKRTVSFAHPVKRPAGPPR